MARTSQGMQNEELKDEDYSSEDMQAYCPNAEDNELDVDERAYLLLEQINLEWPAQSIAISDSKIYLGTNPTADGGNPELIEISLKDTDFQNLVFRDAVIKRSINKIRYAGNLYGISDDHLTVYDNDMKVVAEVKDKFSYGLCVTEDRVFAGTQDGRLLTFDRELRQLNSVKLHSKSIEAIGFSNDCIFTGSVDCKLHITDSNYQIIKTIENKSDINCLDVYENRLVFGDDDSQITVVDLTSFAEQKIVWHNTPISAVRWKDADVFASASDEQVCIWDLSLDDEWEFHKNLLFVHQGQQLYKDVCFDGDRVVTTAIDGLCVFTPVSFSNVEV